MAIIYGKDRETDYASGNLAPIGKSYSRMGAAPLDMYEVWYDKEALIAYASNLGTPQADGSYDTSSVLSYVGQKVAYVDEQNKKIFHYSIELDGTLKEIGNTFLEGTLIDISAANTKGEVTISHEKVAAPVIATGTGRTYITSIETDGYGHITKIYTATETDQEVDIPAVLEGTYIDVTVDEDGNYVVSHENAPALSVDTANTYTSRFVTGITRDAQGHITGYKTEQVLIPDVTLDNVSIDRTTDGKIQIKDFAAATTVEGNIPRVVVKNGTKTIEWVTVKEAVSDIKDENTVTTIEAGNDGVEVELISQTADEIKYEISHADAPTAGNAATTSDGSGRTYVTNVLIDSFGHVAKVETATETVVDTNTSHYHVNGLGTVASADGGIDEEDVAINLNIGIKLADKKNDAGDITGKEIVIYDKTSNAEIAKMDAADLVEDSYLNDVTVDDDTSTLKFTFTLNNGTTKEVDVDLAHLVDTYTGEKGIYVEGYKIGHTNEVTAKTAFELETKALAHGDTFEVVEEKYDAQGHITGKQKVTYTLPEATDISGKMDLVPDATAGHYAIFDENGQVVDGGYIDADLSVHDTFESDEDRPGVLGFNVYEKQTVDGAYEENPVIGYYLEVERDSGLDLYDTNLSTDNGSSANNKSRIAMGKIALSEATKASLAKADAALPANTLAECVTGTQITDSGRFYSHTANGETNVTIENAPLIYGATYTLTINGETYTATCAGDEMMKSVEFLRTPGDTYSFVVGLSQVSSDDVCYVVIHPEYAESNFEVTYQIEGLGIERGAQVNYINEVNDTQFSVTNTKLELATGIINSLNKADTAVQTITTIDTSAEHTHGTETNCGGLKATKTGSTVNIEIDDSITFILNCGSAADL